MPEREHEADGDGAFALVHQLAGDVVDCGDVVSIDCVAEAKAIGKECGAQEQGIGMKGDDCPEPDGEIECQQDAIDADYFGSGVACFVVEQYPWERGHRLLSPGDVFRCVAGFGRLLDVSAALRRETAEGVMYHGAKNSG